MDNKRKYNNSQNLTIKGVYVRLNKESNKSINFR